MSDALEMLEYTTILNRIAELTHTEAARRRALELRPTKDLALIYQRAHWIGQAARCLEDILLLVALYGVLILVTKEAYLAYATSSRMLPLKLRVIMRMSLYKSPFIVHPSRYKSA